MGRILVLREDRRKNYMPDFAPENERRKFEKKNITDSELDNLIRHCERRSTELETHLRDKEKKKLTIMVSSFAVLSLVTTISFGIAKIYAEQKLGTFTTALFCLSLLGFLGAIAFINIAIIKYSVALKMDCLLAVRQINCNRQAIHTFLYAKWQRAFPERQLSEMKNESDFSGTILDRGTHFWKIYGRHEKYALNNVDLRATYVDFKEKKGSLLKRLALMPADIFAIYTVAVFTFVLLVLPIPVFILFADSLTKVSTLVALFVGAISLLLANKSWMFVSSVVNSAIDKIIGKLKNDETFKYEP